MPRIDPLQLLKCLSVLLASNGGIKSREEVQRLASLMTKFSKKLVSKCIYIQILKTTKTDLLGMFMTAGGWNLVHTWLSDGIVAKNWPLIQELLELLLMCPVDVERLKTNSCPKLIKGLSKDSSDENVRLFAGKLVEQWLRIVKGECVEPGKYFPVSEIRTAVPICSGQAKAPEGATTSEEVKVREVVNKISVKQEPVEETVDKIEVDTGSVKQEPAVETMSIKAEGSNIKLEKVEKVDEDLDGMGSWNGPVGQLPVYKITIRDGKQVLAKVYSGDRTKKLPNENEEISEESSKFVVIKKACAKPSESEVTESDITGVETEEKTEIKSPNVKLKPKAEKQECPTESSKPKELQKRKDGQSSKVPDKRVKLDGIKDKLKDKENTKNKDKLKVKEKVKDKEKEKGKEKDREKEKEKENKDKKLMDTLSEKELAQIEKDKASIAKLIPPAISKLGKIPKKPKLEETQKNDCKSAVTDVKKSPDSSKKPVADPKKNSISIEIRNKDASRPKTVKKFNSKFRSTGLEEEVKPPPRVLKKTVPLPEKKPVKLIPLKRPSPPRETVSLEKKMKPTLDVPPEDAKKNDKAGSIKLIAPRPKPSFLQESDMFMDALTASTKKEPRKRKRRASTGKDGLEHKKEAGNRDDSTPPSSPGTEELKSPPVMKPALKFYQDTMETEEEKESDSDIKEIVKKEENDENDGEGEEKCSTPTPECDDESGDSGESDEKKRKLSQDETMDAASPENESSEERPAGALKGVLIYHKSRRGPKKLVRWKPEKDLETIKYFELDETERVNVTKNFMDMKQIERSHEREALLSRKLPHDDQMEEETPWLALIPIDCPPPLAEPRKFTWYRTAIILKSSIMNCLVQSSIFDLIDARYRKE